jgi:hypothetical protein
MILKAIEKMKKRLNSMLWEILHIIGEEIEKGVEFHIHFNKELISIIYIKLNCNSFYL